MLFRFRSGATGYLGTVIATAETWRMQVFGSKGWAEVGDVEHLTTWQMKVCLHRPGQHHDQAEAGDHDVSADAAPSAPSSSISRAPWRRGRPLAVPGGDEVHNVAVLEAILESAQRRARRVQRGECK